MMDEHPETKTRDQMRIDLEHLLGLRMRRTFWRPWIKAEVNRARNLLHEVDEHMVTNLKQIVAQKSEPLKFQTLLQLLGQRWIRRANMLHNT